MCKMGIRKRFVRIKRLISILMRGNLKRIVFYVNVLLSNINDSKIKQKRKTNINLKL